MTVEDVQPLLEATRAAEELERETAPEAVLVPPPSTEVALPLGLWDPVSGLRDRAEVRELNGFDEEAIARSTTQGSAINTVLERAVVRIGDEKATPKALEDISLGDRVELLLAISRVTWGDEVKVPGECNSCGTESVFDVSISQDIPRRLLDDKNSQWSFTLNLPSGRAATLNYPGGLLHKKILNGTVSTSAEMVTEMIMTCMTSLSGAVIVDRSVAAGMSLRDRQAVSEALESSAPGPQLHNVEKQCPSCGGNVPAPVSVGALFPF